MPRGQLSLFGDEPERPAADRLAVGSAEITTHVRTVAAALPAAIRLGTSSWSFPGWTGLVYAPSARTGRPHAEATLAKAGLPAYAAHPLLRTEG